MKSDTPLIPLEDWGRLHFDPPQPIRTLRRWARTDHIRPKPELVGREYRVQADAVYVRPVRKPRIQPIKVIKSKDPVVHDIIASGKTQKRGQA